MFIVASDTSAAVAAWVLIYLSVILLSIPLAFLIKKWPFIGLVLGIINLSFGLLGLSDMMRSSSGIYAGIWLICTFPLLTGTIYIFAWWKCRKRKT